MAFDGIVVGAVASALNEKLASAKVEKIYHPQDDEIVIFFHTRSGKYKLYVSSGSNHPGVFLTEKNYENPAVPGNFCMFLRKHLGSARLVAVTQKDTERIIEILFETRDEMGFESDKKLLIEIMGKHSNIILTDNKTGKIMDSIKRLTPDVNRARQVLPGRPYVYPPSGDKIPFTQVTEKVMEEVWANENAGEEIADRIMNSFEGISPLVARQLAMEVTPAECAGELQRIAKMRAEDFTPAVYSDERGPKDFHVLSLSEYDSYIRKDFESVSEAIEWYYDNKNSANRIKQKSAALSKSVDAALKKLYLKKQRLGEDLLRAEDSDKYQLYGELLTANLHLIKTGDKTARLINYYDNSEIEIPLDERFGPAKNAQKYFKKYSKSKRAVKEKNIQLRETQKDIDYLESVSDYIDNANSSSEVDALREELHESGFVKKRKQTQGKNRKSKYEPFVYTSSDGFTIMVGRNNRENDHVTFKVAGRKDIWFHTKDIPGSHVILFTKGREPSDKALFEAASLAAYHSKARNSENVPVDYTEVRYVKKPNGAKPGMVIFTDNHTLYVEPKKP